MLDLVCLSRYGLYDPLKGEPEDSVGNAAGQEGRGAPKGAGGINGGLGAGEGGLPGAFSPRGLAGVGDKGAG